MIVKDAKLVAGESFDGVFSFCGYESRSTHILDFGLQAPIRVAMQSNADSVGSLHKSNEARYLEGGWLMSPLDWRAIISELCTRPSSRILIDISSMPRSMIASIVETVTTSVVQQVDVQFAYFPATFEESASAAMRDESLHAGPVSSFYSGELRSPRIPLGLVIGLGLERYRALGLIEMLEPERTWSLVGEAKDSRFDLGAVAAHDDFMTGPAEPALLSYPVSSIAQTYGLIESLLHAAKPDYRMILAPSGPKMLSLVSCLLAAPRSSNRPALWRVGSPKPSVAHDVRASGEVVSAIVTFSFDLTH